METRYCTFCREEIRFPFGGGVCLPCALDNKSGNYLTKNIPAKYCTLCGEKLNQDQRCVHCEKIIAQKIAKEEEKKKSAQKVARTKS